MGLLYGVITGIIFGFLLQKAQLLHSCYFDFLTVNAKSANAYVLDRVF